MTTATLFISRVHVLWKMQIWQFASRIKPDKKIGSLHDADMLLSFFLKICLMTITQHAHIYNFHTSNICLKKYFFLNFYQCRLYFERCHPCLRVRRVRRHRDHTLAAGPRSNPRSLPGWSRQPPHRLWPRRPPPPLPIIPPRRFCSFAPCHASAGSPSLPMWGAFRSRRSAETRRRDRKLANDISDSSATSTLFAT